MATSKSRQQLRNRIQPTVNPVEQLEPRQLLSGYPHSAPPFEYFAGHAYFISAPADGDKGDAAKGSEQEASVWNTLVRELTDLQDVRKVLEEALNKTNGNHVTDQVLSADAASIKKNIAVIKTNAAGGDRKAQLQYTIYTVNDAIEQVNSAFDDAAQIENIKAAVAKVEDVKGWLDNVKKVTDKWGNCIAPGAIKNAGVSGQISEQNTTSRHMLARLIRAIYKKVAFLT